MILLLIKKLKVLKLNKKKNMIEGRIGDKCFEYEKNSKKINIYVIGDIDPVSYIPVDEDLTEKEFHYEIMTWSIQKGC